MQCPARSVPRGVSTLTPHGSAQRTASAGVPSSTSPSRRRNASAPRPPGTRRFSPSNLLSHQSRNERRSASAAAMIAPSQAPTVADQGSAGSSAAASGTSGRFGASSGSARASSPSQVRWRAASSSCVAGRPSTRTRRARPANASSTGSPCCSARCASGLRSASWSHCAPSSNGPSSSAGRLVQARPPARDPASSTTTGMPSCRSARAAARPATPAPTTMTPSSLVPSPRATVRASSPP